MNTETAQKIIDDLVCDIEELLKSNPSKQRCAWWKGRASGISDTIQLVSNNINFDALNEAFQEIHRYEKIL